MVEQRSSKAQVKGSTPFPHTVGADAVAFLTQGYVLVVSERRSLCQRRQCGSSSFGKSAGLISRR